MRSYLLVDDNRAFAENLAEILEDSGSRATLAVNGSEALECIRKERFHAVLTDMRMPLMSGAELVHELRKLDPGLPVVMATAYSGDEDLQIARREGLLALLSKPVNIPFLTQTLECARRDGMVALVEDDPALSDNLSEVLRGAGFTAVTAASVLETERLGPVKPFAALVDLRVPGGPDGEALRRLVAKYPGTPVIVMTAHTLEPAPAKTHRWMRKPFSTDELLVELERLYTERERAP